MSENTCPNVALSRNQNMWVVKESADKTLGFPAVTDIINVTANVFANQEIPTSDSKEKANTLNKLNVFNSSASPATANFGMYLRPTALDAPTNIENVLYFCAQFVDNLVYAILY